MTDLQDALDGLQTAEDYAEQIGEDELANLIAQDYQRLGAAAPDEDWGLTMSNSPNRGVVESLSVVWKRLRGGNE